MRIIKFLPGVPACRTLATRGHSSLPGGWGDEPIQRIIANVRDAFERWGQGDELTWSITDDPEFVTAQQRRPDQEETEWTAPAPYDYEKDGGLPRFTCR